MSIVLTLIIVALDLAGVWSAQQSYPPGPGSARQGFWVQAPSGAFDDAWATPIAGSAAPLDDVLHVELYVTPQGGGSLSAFIRNPEENLGAFIGTRTLTVSGATATLRAQGRSDIVGRYDAAANTLTFRFDEAPGAFVFHRQPQAQPASYRYVLPATSNDGWPVGSLADADIDVTAMTDVIRRTTGQPPASLRAPYIQSVTIARHGKLVLDAYFNGFEADGLHDVRSAGKSVTTLLVGRAIEDGVPFGAGSLVYSLLGNYGPFGDADPRKARMTVADLMSMQSGYACDDNDDSSPGNEDTMQSQTKQPNWYRYTLDLPMQANPETKAAYCSAGINLLGAIVAQGTKTWLPAYFASRVGRPMQFGRYAMWLMPAPVDDAYMAGGDRFRPRDFLKFGQLFLNKGSWNGVQVVDAAWLAAIATKRSTIAGEIGDYGWGWHLYQYQVRGRQIDAIIAGGNGGQLLFVFPQLDMTLMITAANYGQYPVWSGFITTLVPQLLDAVH